MPKALCYSGIIVAASLVLLFGLDLAVGFPFGRASLVMTIGMMVGGIILGALSFLTLREQQ